MQNNFATKLATSVDVNLKMVTKQLSDLKTISVISPPKIDELVDRHSLVAAEEQNWRVLVRQYQQSQKWVSIWQLCNTFIPFFVLWYGMYRSLEISYLLTLLLSVPMAGLLLRIFIFQHDCGHGSFFKSGKVNNWVGVVCGFFTLTPYYYWRKSHAIHHAHSGNLDHRGVGDIHTKTVEEYLSLSVWGRLQYRVYRNPFFLFVLAPTLLFVFVNRVPTYPNKAMKRVESSVWWTDLGIAVLVGAVIWFVGWQAFLLVHMPIVMIAATAGTFMFYVQHQFEEAYWANQETWDYTLAALQGSSYYQLPKVLQWFTGNIGFHHIHHLSPRIPNYQLQKCHDENPLFQETLVMTIKNSFESLPLTLWDEKEQKLIGFRQLKAIRT